MKKKEAILRPIHFSPSDLEIVLGLGKTKINELLNSERLPSYMLDGSRFIHSKDVWSFVAKLRNEQNSDLDFI